MGVHHRDFMAASEEDTASDKMINPLDHLAFAISSCPQDEPNKSGAKPPSDDSKAGSPKPGKRKRPAKFSTQNAVECLAQPMGLANGSDDTDKPAESDAKAAADPKASDASQPNKKAKSKASDQIAKGICLALPLIDVWPAPAPAEDGTGDKPLLIVVHPASVVSADAVALQTKVKGPRGASLQPSSTASRTCQACAIAKVKCDREQPCARCVRKALDCCPQLRGRGRPSSRAAQAIHVMQAIAQTAAIAQAVAAPAVAIDPNTIVVAPLAEEVN